METYLNLLHFCLYKALHRLRWWFNQLNPAHLLTRLPYLKRRYAKLGVNISKEMDVVFALGDRRSVTAAGAALCALIGLVLFALLLAVDRDVNSNCLYGCFLVGFVIAYFFVFRNDKYRAYFARYEHWSSGERLTYSGVTLASVGAMVLLFRWVLTP